MSADIPPRATAWLSEGLECLVQRIGPEPSRAGTDFDVVVVGSGYGGAIAASSLAGRGGTDGRVTSVCVLERGKEYLPGAFPSRMADLAGHVRFSTEGTIGPRGAREGLFDVRIGSDVSALVANGLGGGSLINAGVMVEPTGAALARLEAATGKLGPFYERARGLLGAAGNTILDHQSGAVPRKYSALGELAQQLGPHAIFEPAPITVSMRKGPNTAGIAMEACRQCGDCATGCNFNAKESLDSNLLVKARRAGARLFTGATVVRIERDEAGARWCLHVAYTDEHMRKRMPEGLVLFAAKVILAAGTYGSTEILMRSRCAALGFSPLLGQKFSSNGDMIAVVYDQQQEVNAVADEDVAPAARGIGPTITGMIRVPCADGDLLVEELAVPGPMRRLFEEVMTTARTLQQLGRPDHGDHAPHDVAQDPCAVDGRAIRQSAVLAVMGDDGAAGQMRLVGAPGDAEAGIRIHWPELRYHRLFERQAALLAAAIGTGGTLLPNPMWKLLPDDMAYLLNGRRGPLLTVHPLGGCPIGADATEGAVNANGQVFQAGAGARDVVYRSLVVLDGAIVPCALGVNPALTIAALALRAVENLCVEWGFGEAGPGIELGPRPVFRIMPEKVAIPAPTVVQFVERMTGRVTLKAGDGTEQECMLELTLRFDPRPLGPMFLPQAGQPVPLRRMLDVGPDSTLALYDLPAWRAWREEGQGTDAAAPAALLKAPLGGTLGFFHREKSSHLQRVGRTVIPWLRNRGLRDTWQWWFGPIDGADPRADAVQQSGWQRLTSALALASRAGEVRRFDYQLTIGAPLLPTAWPGAAGFRPGDSIAGHKRLTYGRASNPWLQLMRMTLTRFPALVARTGPAILELDTGFLVKENTPLLRILSQQDQPGALADTAGMAGYMLRLLLSIHMWSFRKPDSAPRRTPQRLPPPLPGLRMDRFPLAFPDLPDGTPVGALLTRYRGDAVDAALPPILMIHGYSASGTTFAHGSVQPNLAGYMCARRRDVWVLDMRTSSGMPTATHPWEFEDAAHNDIPVAVARVCQLSEHARIDVVAHCMGAAMFGMAVLGKPQPGEPYEAERNALPDRINSVVLSQVGPLVVFSQANIFRAYLMGYARYLLPNVKLPFTVENEPGMSDEVIDRLLATLPYPDAEFKIENPAWPWQRAGFVGTRHRMDALYGRDFQLANIDAAILERIDDFFGPYNLVTLNQAIHFARLKTITNRAGRNRYVSRRRLQEVWRFPTHSIHGTENGLADVSTLARMAYVLDDAGCPFTRQQFDGYGHQDCLIGRGAVRVFAEIARFLDSKLPAADAGGPHAGVAADPGAGDAGAVDGMPPTPPPAALEFIARIPWTGPLRSGLIRPPDQDGIARMPIGAAAGPILNLPDFVALVPVVEQAGHYAIFNPGGETDRRRVLIKNVELFTTENADDEDGWVQLCAKPTPEGADGVLMLMIYNAAAGLEPPADQWFTPEGELMGRLAHYNPRLLAQSALLDWVYARTGPVCSAIDLVLLSTPALTLRLGVIDAREDRVGPGIAVASVAQVGNAAAAVPAAQVCFAVASCQYPAGMLDGEQAYASYARLAARLDRASDAPKPSFIALLGDQIYADATAGLFDPTALDDRYARPYETFLRNRHVKNVLRRLPAMSMIDDHEIEDNWEPGPAGADETANQARRAAGVAAFLKFQRTADLASGAGVAAAPRDQLDFSFFGGGLPFYFANTRTEREARTPHNIATAAIMGKQQFCRLTTWLLAQHEAYPEAPKFLATPSIVAPGRVGPARGGDGPEGDLNIACCLRYDSWAGYPSSLQALLMCITDARIQNVVLLSGDEHISCDSHISVKAGDGAPVQIRAIHSSALYAPYPFANSCLSDMADEVYSFGFDAPDGSKRHYSCEVRTRYAPGEGCAIITATQERQVWKVDCEFDRAS
jgi:cholesterol oxidase